MEHENKIYTTKHQNMIVNNDEITISKNFSIFSVPQMSKKNISAINFISIKKYISLIVLPNKKNTPFSEKCVSMYYQRI